MIKQTLTGTGTIVYDPVRMGMKQNTKWWCIVNVDNGNEIARLFRWHLSRHFLDGIDFVQQSWNCHVSIIRGEIPSQDTMHLWGKYNNQKVSFEYSVELKQNKEFWFVEIEAPHLVNIRKEFCKPADWPLHMTIGKFKIVDNIDMKKLQLEI